MSDTRPPKPTWQKLPVYCQWSAMCDNPPVGWKWEPILGWVAACSTCGQ